MPSTEATLRLTVAALMRLTGERQTDLAAVIRISQTPISRKQSGAATWTLDNLDRLSAHYGIPVPDLVAGIQCLPARRRAPLVGAAHLTISP
ncbi:acyltransferase [Streptomyces cyaneofuscatus]|uniref:acyltransferase n=2 Tax=Streptomyces cyaneofuscatus TaxID=66883 RepID=UPI003812BD78